MNGHTIPTRQRGLSLIAVAIVMALLAAAAMGGLYWMRYERNPITDIMNGRVAATGKPPAGMTSNPVAAVTAPPAAPAGPIRKCTIHGKTVYSDVDCAKSGEKIRIRDTAGLAPTPKPMEESASGSASMTLQQKALDKEIEKATK